MDELKRKAILDGMLFEVFFDPLARLRTQFKFGSFQSVFALQTVKELAPSFDFIAECLLPDIGRFHVLPGKKHAAVVDVKTKPGTLPGQHIVEGIYFGGSNILWLEDLDYAPEPGETPPREKLSVTSFEDKLAEQMVVPTHLLNVKYASELDDGVTRPKILFPYGWTTRKR